MQRLASRDHAVTERRTRSIVVVDADEGNRRLLTWALGRRVDATAAFGGERTGLGQCALVLADAEHEQLTTIGERCRDAAVPLVLMTSSLSRAIAQRAATVGASACIHRPIFVDELRQTIARLLRQRPTTLAPAST